MAAEPPMHGKGILFVPSKISRPDILDVPTFMNWYDNDHIPEVVHTSGIRSARRLVNIDPTVDRPYLAIYPMEDLGFTQGKEFRSVRVKSDFLPGSGVIFDMAEIDVYYHNLVHVYDESKKGKGAMKSLITVAIELKEGASADELDRWYREEHCAMIAKHKDYLRTTRFKLVYARTNAQSRVLKGLASATDAPAPEPATWLSLHEFQCDSDQLNIPELGELTSSPWTEKILASLDVHDVNVYSLAKEFGEKDWFHGVEV